MHILLGMSCFAVAVLVAVVVVFATWRVFSRVGPGKLEHIRSGNTAAAVVLGGELLAFAILMLQCLYPVSAVLQNLFLERASAPVMLKNVGLIVAYVVLGYTLAVATVRASSWLFQRLTKGLDELEEIREGNIAVAVALAVVTIAVALMVQSGLADLLNSMIPQVGSELVRAL